jgi:hypothetical protein
MQGGDRQEDLGVDERAPVEGKREVRLKAHAGPSLQEEAAHEEGERDVQNAPVDEAQDVGVRVDVPEPLTEKVAERPDREEEKKGEADEDDLRHDASAAPGGIADPGPHGVAHQRARRRHGAAGISYDDPARLKTTADERVVLRTKGRGREERPVPRDAKPASKWGANRGANWTTAEYCLGAGRSPAVCGSTGGIRHPARHRVHADQAASGRGATASTV